MDIKWRVNPESPAQPGVAIQDLEAWRIAYKITLPAILKAALLIQDGGMVHNSDLRLYKLCELKPPNSDEWKDIQNCNEEKPADQFRLIEFAEDEENYQRYFLDFSESPLADKPSVWGYWSDGWDIELVAASLDEFITQKCSKVVLTDSCAETNWQIQLKIQNEKSSTTRAAALEKLKVEAKTRYAALMPQQQEKVRLTLAKNEFQIMSGKSVVTPDMEPAVANAIEWMSQLMREGV